MSPQVGQQVTGMVFCGARPQVGETLTDFGYAMNSAVYERQGIEYDKVMAAHGNPVPFLRKGSRDELEAATGDKKLPALKLSDGTVIKHSKAILTWVEEQPSGG